MKRTIGLSAVISLFCSTGAHAFETVCRSLPNEEPSVVITVRQKDPTFTGIYSVEVVKGQVGKTLPERERREATGTMNENWLQLQFADQFGGGLVGPIGDSQPASYSPNAFMMDPPQSVVCSIEGA